MLWWEEEVELLDEEMRQVLSFSDWKVQWWSNRVELRPGASPELQEGLKTFMFKHIASEGAKKDHLIQKWAPLR